MTKLAVTIDDVEYNVEIRDIPSSPNEMAAIIDGEEIPVFVPGGDEFEAYEWIVIGSRPYEVAVDSDLNWLQAFDGRHEIEVRDLDATVSRPVSGDGRIKAPIPGLITRIMVEPGQEVEVGQPLVVLEAMKMENEIQAPRSGQVQHLAVEPGQTVVLDDLLIEIG
jgi:biotin carboxyl carrier protein